MRRRPSSSFLAFGLAATVASLSTACHGAGPYGHAPVYEPLDDEAKAASSSRELDTVAYEQKPDEWRKGPVMAFGFVDDRQPGPGGQAMLKLSVRRLEPRNFCQKANDDDTCRVTVSDKDYGVVYALVALHGDDDTGPLAVRAESLVRVVGMIGEDVNNAPVIHATFYRHWPRNTYVTRSATGEIH
jgi:hypothetical protein